MQLRIIEIEAIKKRVLDEITSKLVIPDFSKELSEFLNDLIEIDKIDTQISKLDEDKSKLVSKYDNFRINFYKYKGENDFIEKKLKLYKTLLETEYVKKMIPSGTDIQNDIILSSNKDLSELVKEIIAKYSK